MQMKGSAIEDLGGKVEAGESLVECAVRELDEECSPAGWQS